MKHFSFFVSTALLAACGGPAFGSGPGTPASLANPTLLTDDVTSRQRVYWTLFASAAYPQVQIAAVPLRANSKTTSIFNNANNSLLYSSGMHVDKAGRLWILAFGAHSGDPGSVSVFTLPLKATSTPKYTFVLSGTSDPDHLTFDHLGHLWVNSHGNNAVLEYTGPFTKSGTLRPKTTLTTGITSPSGIALDRRGNLYVALSMSDGANSIAVFKTPISNKKPFHLAGLDGPGGLIFDAKGNLYASSNGGSHAAIVRYNSGDLAKGDKPSVADSVGFPAGSYESDFAITKAGDLYYANCGNASSVGVYVYPTSKKAFSSKLSPSVFYTNAYLQSAGCAWGIAIK
ncbi:MAG: hypothetical protein WB681_04855 [Candidatus Cybelea sp.]